MVNRFNSPVTGPVNGPVTGYLNGAVNGPINGYLNGCLMLRWTIHSTVKSMDHPVNGPVTEKRPAIFDEPFLQT